MRLVTAVQSCRYLRKTGCEDFGFDDSNLVIQPPEHGHGIAFERHSLLAGKLEAKRSRGFDVGIRSTSQYYLVTDPEQSSSSHQKVLAWLEKRRR